MIYYSPKKKKTTGQERYVSFLFVSISTDYLAGALCLELQVELRLVCEIGQEKECLSPDLDLGRGSKCPNLVHFKID